MPSILPFRVEYATEKRVCKKCRASIPIFAIQMAIIQQVSPLNSIFCIILTVIGIRKNHQFFSIKIYNRFISCGS